MKRSMRKVMSAAVALLLMAVMLCAGAVSALATTVTDAAERTGLSFKVETTNGLEHPTGYYYSPKQLEQIPVTFEAWVYIPSERYSGKNAVISNFLEIGGDEFFDFCIHSNGIPTLYVGRGLGKDYATFKFSDAQVPADTWTHVSVVYGTGSEGKQAFCYINGELKHQSAASDYVPMNDRVLENPVCLGGDLRSFNQQWFKGQLGEVRVYADVRSQAEIAADMTTAADRNDQDLIMYYELSAELSGKDVEDKGPNGYDMLYGEMWLVEQEMEHIRATDSNEYAYSIAVLPDPQFSTESYPNSLKATFDYLLDNAEAKNIQYVLSVGDMTNGNTEAQWENIKAQTERLNGKLPYTAIRGNHDVYYNGSAELFDQYYADPSGYYYQHVRENGGFYDTSSVKNTYLLFEVGNVKYLLLNLDFGANDSVLAWADGILSQYADRRVIAITHAYMDADGTTLDDYDSGSPSTNANKGDLGWNSGEDMWNELFKKHENVQMVICGHIQQDDVVLRTRKGDEGNTVYQLLIDTQTSDKMIKGGGFVAMLYFTEDGNNVRVECYSTVQEKYFRSTSNTISFTVGSEYEPQPLPELPPIKEASLTYGNETTYYASLQEAIDAANAGNGGTIKLLTNVDYGTCTTGVSFAHDTTIDGQGRYKITATVGKEFLQPAAGVTLKLKDLDLIVTSTTANKYWNAVYVNKSNATVIIEGCTIQSTNDNPIKVQSGAAGSNIQIIDSTVIGHYLGIYMNNAPCKVKIENSTIIDRLSAVYVSGTSSTPDITITNSTLTSGGYNGSTAYGALTIKEGKGNVTLGAGTVIDSTAIDSMLAQKYGITVDDYTGAPYGVWFYNGGAPALTLTGDVTLSGEEADLYLQVGTVDFVDYTGTQIIRQNGTTYYFYDTVDAAFTAKQDGDSIFSYAASSVQNKGYVTQTATDASSTIYYKVVGLDTSLIESAIANANDKKNSVVQADKPCEAGVGNKYVSAAQMQALNQAIAAAEAKKASATTGGAVIEAVQALNDALASFETAILTGVAHKDDGRDHVCDYGCDVYQGVHADSANDNDHDCEYCGERLNDCTPNEDDGDCTTAITCSVCGAVTTAAKAAHTPGADDGDCTTAVYCTECEKVATAAKAAHTPGADDGDCTTAITCTECGTVTTAAKAAHTPGEDDGDCTTAVYCTECEKVATAAKAAHTPAEDDGDCTTAITCTECGTVTTAAKAAHTPGADDGDCTTAVYCTECEKVATAAKAAHTGGTATCTAKAACSICGKAYGELTQHTYDSETDASCNVCGAERAVENQTNGNENTANGSENNAQNGNTEAPAKQGLSGGAVAGIVIGVVAVLGGGGFALFWFVIKKKKV